MPFTIDNNYYISPDNQTDYVDLSSFNTYYNPYGPTSTTSATNYIGSSDGQLRITSDTNIVRTSDPYYDISGDGGGGVNLVRGCTNPRAVNYNPQATIDDGSCEILGSPVNADDILADDEGNPINTDDYIPIIPVADSILYIKFTSDPTNAAILIDDKDSGKFTSNTLQFDSRELMTTKTFTIIKNGFTSNVRYRIKSIFIEDGTGVYKTKYTIDRFDGSRWSNQEVVVSSGGRSYATLDFPLTLDSIPIDNPKSDVRVYTVKFEVNVPSNDIIRYRTSNLQTGFLKDNEDITVTINHRLFGESPWIQLEKVGITNQTHNIKYTITNPNSISSNVYTDDFTKVLTEGTTKIVVDVDKNVQTPVVLTPNLVVENDNLEYNFASNSYIDISYRTENADKISYTIGNLVREGQSQGSVRLRNSDFRNGIGQYTVILQPLSNRNGSGAVKRVNINVVSKTYLPGPDITKINYPYNIKGADFKGYNEDFKISWQSVNTNYVEIYVTKKSSEFSLAKVAGSGALTLNVADVLRKARRTFNDSTDVLSFDLILIPYNTESDRVVSGKEEKITIVFDKSDIKLVRNQVLRDIRVAFELDFNEEIFREQTSRFLTHLAHFGGADNKLISTWGIDTETFSEYAEGFDTNGVSFQYKSKEFKSLVLKLYEPLPGQYQPNQQLWISKAQTLPIIEQFVLTDDDVDSCIELKPNLSLEISDEVGYQILDDLVASGSVSSTELIQQYIGDNEFSLAKLDLDFVSGSDYSWENFVKYSSAAERVENFVYKVQTIEFYSSSLADLGEVTASIVSVENEVTRTNEKVTNIKRGFDAFENFLYTSTDALAYPKSGSVVLPSTDSSVTSWYNGIVASAQDFDLYNKDKLTNNIPIHFVNDINGQDYVLFFNMIGQHFDILWSYIKKFSKSKQLGHTNQSGITDELIYHMLESLGWDADMGVKSQVLWEYAFGKNKDGTDTTSNYTSSTTKMTGKERQQEIWRRILNNLPYLYKHKGTKRALNAAMACYGVPTSMLTIMEFGGPVDPTQTGTTQFTFDDRTASINFDGTASVLVPWITGSWGTILGETNYPQALEFRINTETIQEHRIAAGDRWELYILPTYTGSLARVEFRITGSTPGIYVSASTEPFPLFNDVYTQIVVNRSVSGSLQTYDLYAKEGFNERIRNEGSATVSFATASLQWSQGTEITIGEFFTGTMDEFRLWNTNLNESRVINHTLLPDAIDGNHISASTEDLVFRLDFEYPKDRNADTEIKNVAINQTYYESPETSSYATAQNFSSVTTYPFQYTPYERTVTANVPSTGVGLSNKIRFESRTLDNYLNFGSISNATTFENADDSNKLGLFFSPTGQINLDILRSLGEFNIDNYIGNPADQYEDTYTELDLLRNYYFQRYNLNIYEYIQLVRYIDQTLFTTLKSLVPGRADVSHGLLIEPHLLERSKIAKKPAIAENIGLDSEIDVNDDVNITSENILEEVTIDTADDISLEVENPQWDGTVDASTEIDLIGTTPFYDGTIAIADEEELSGEYRTWETTINAQYTGSIQGEYDSTQYQSIGMDPDGITRAGFGIWAENGVTIRTTLDAFGNRIQRRQRVYQIKEQRVVNIPENINQSDSSLGTYDVPTTFYDYRVTFLNYSQSAPSVVGDIVEVTPVNGYLPSHYKYVGDLPTGLQNSWYNGSKQTSLTTLDGSSPVQTFTTNPNTLRVNEAGRGSGEPILEVD